MGEPREIDPLSEAVKAVCGEFARDRREPSGFFAAEVDGIVIVGAKSFIRQRELLLLVDEWGGTIDVPKEAGPPPEDAHPQKDPVV